MELSAAHYLRIANEHLLKYAAATKAGASHASMADELRAAALAIHDAKNAPGEKLLKEQNGKQFTLASLEAYLFFLDALWRSGDPAELDRSLYFAERAAHLQPNHFATQYLLAKLYERENRLPDALEAAKRAAKIQEFNPEAIGNVKRLERLFQSDRSDAAHENIASTNAIRGKSAAADVVTSGQIFISYRRDDSAGYAGRIHDRLEREFGHDRLFMDVEHIPLGLDFVATLREAVAKCDVLLVLIGLNWLDVRDARGIRRLDNQNDYVRIEVATALQRDIPVIPILFDDVGMPSVDQMPKDIEALAQRNGLNIRHVAFNNDMDKLITALRGELGRKSAALR